jgi:hypothetical protein
LFPSKNGIRSSLGCILLLGFTLGTPAYAATDSWFFGKDQWTHGGQLNARFLGHLGESVAVNAPPGGIYLEAQYSLWWEHAIEAHAQVLLSRTDESFSGFGGGLKINVLEFSKANAMEFAGQTTAGMRCIETRRGIFSSALRSLLVYVAADMVHYSFPEPSPEFTYNPSQWSLHWGGGVQWGPNIRIPGISRMYIDTGVMFTKLASSIFLVPSAGIGLNF